MSCVLEFVTFVFMPEYGGILSIARTFQFYPCFVAGYMMQNKLSKIEKYRKVLLGLFIPSVAGVLLTSCRLQHVVFFHRDGLSGLMPMTHQSAVVFLIFRYGLIMCSIVISSEILLMTYKSGLMKKVAERVGCGTLFIFFGQTLLYPIANKYFHSLGMELIISFTCIVFLTFLSNMKISGLLMRPVSSFARIVKGRG